MRAPLQVAESASQLSTLMMLFMICLIGYVLSFGVRMPSLPSAEAVANSRE